MSPVRGRTAADAGSEREALFFVESAEMLQRWHARHPVAGVLTDSRALVAVDAGVAVGHVGGALLVRDVDEADPGAPEHVQARHERRPDDAEDRLDPLHAQRLDQSFL